LKFQGKRGVESLMGFSATDGRVAIENSDTVGVAVLTA